MLTTYSKAKLLLMLYNNIARDLYSEYSGIDKGQAYMAMAILAASPDFPKFVEAQQLTPDARLYEHSIFEKREGQHATPSAE